MRALRGTPDDVAKANAARWHWIGCCDDVIGDARQLRRDESDKGTAAMLDAKIEYWRDFARFLTESCGDAGAILRLRGPADFDKFVPPRG